MPTKFNSGRVVATTAAIQALNAAGLTSLNAYLDRHLAGDWGDLDSNAWQENEEALKHGFRLLSVYTLPTGTRIWIITESDRSVTTVLLPSDY